MIVLGVDTAGANCAACLYNSTKQKILAKVSKTIERGHSEFLPSIINHVLESADLSFDHLTHLAVTEGPGSFVGIRVGISYIRTLAIALDIPAIGISSLNAMALPIALKYQMATLAVLDARRGEVYLTLLSKDGKTLIEPCAIKLENVKNILLQQPMVLCGNGVGIVKDYLDFSSNNLTIAHEDASPPIDIVTQIAVNLNQQGRALSPKPQYLRAVDAKRATTGINPVLNKI